MSNLVRLSHGEYTERLVRLSGGSPACRWALIACLFLVSQVHAAVYYVDANAGDDSYSGTAPTTAWKTMSKVAAATQSGDQVYIEGWSEQLSDAQWPTGRSYFSQSVRKNSVTWTFDQVRPIGQFVNRDFWVLAPASIIAIDPAAEVYQQTHDGQTRTVTIHGSMVNPGNLIPAPQSATHAIDSRIAGWDESLLVKAPLTLQGDQSLMTIRSWKLEDPGCPAWSTTVVSPRPVTRASGILTCLDTIPSKALFRPAYCGNVKAYHYLDNMDLSILPNLTPVPTIPTYQSLYDSMKRSWAPDFPCGWLGDYVHPSEHMPNYGRDLTAKANDIAAALLLDTEQMIRNHGYPANWKQELAVLLIQFGIDSYGIVCNGGGWGWVGGGIGQGRKWPVLFAGLAFDDPAMKSIGTEYGANLQHRHFMDDAQVFYLSQEDVDRFPKVVTRPNCRVDAADPLRVYDEDRQDWSISDDGTPVPYRAGQKVFDYWLVWDVGGAHQLTRVVACEGTNSEILYVQNPLTPGAGKTARLRLFPPERLGMPEWGERHMNQPQNDYYSRGYRISTTGNSLAPAHLSALILRTRDGQTTAKELWNWPAFFDYMDMYMHETFQTDWERQWSRFAAQMWDTYRPQYGPVWPDTEPQTPGENRPPALAFIGSRAVTAGQTLTFTVAATDADGDPITFSATGLPTGATFADRTFTWTPAADQIGSYQVTFTVSDGQAQDSETVAITVEAAPVPNSPPVLAGIGDKSVREDETLSFSVSATDPDDGDDALVYSATGLPSGANFTGRTFTWTPSYDQAGSHGVTFVVSDGRASDSQTVTISVANVNRPPMLNGITDRSVDTGNTLAFSVSGLDPDGDSLMYSASGVPSGASFTGQSFTWTPTTDQAGSYAVTFQVSDGQISDSRTVTVTVLPPAPDTTAPVVARCAPAPDSIQVPTNSLLTLHITDAGSGVDPASVVIQVNGQTVYQGDQAAHTSAAGRCSRSGDKNDYRFIYQADQMSDFDQTMTIQVNAADLEGNVMSTCSYSYVTEMRSFGANRQISRSVGFADQSRPATVTDTAGNLWAVWHEGPQGARDIYVAWCPAGAEVFEKPLRLTKDSQDQCNPDIAAGTDGKVYIAWQDNRQGNWDIFASIGSAGQEFSREALVADSDHNEINPAIIVDRQSPGRVCVAWQDDRNGNQDIYVAESANAFAGGTVSQVTTDMADQTAPDLAVIGQSTICVVWTDMRNGQADIYGAASDAGPWTNVPVVTSTGDQTSPAIAAGPGGDTLHLLWVDSASGNQDVHYASSAGMPASPLTGSSIIDDTSGADQAAPAIVCAASGKVFACWQDARHVDASGGDTDLYFAELSSGTTRTNILVGDGNLGADQSEPALGVDGYGQPYMVWTDGRGRCTEIYYAASTFIDPQPLDSRMIAASAGGTVGTDPATISKPDDVSIVLPPGACQADVRVTISKVRNPQGQAIEFLGSYDFGPSGIDFDQPVTVTVPYQYPGKGKARPYWYDSLTGALSQQGITDIETIALSSDLNALRFKTTHFTPFYIVAGTSEDAALEGYSSLGTGCSISATGAGSPTELIAPYAVIALVMIVLRRRDRRRRKLLDAMHEVRSLRT